MGGLKNPSQAQARNSIFFLAYPPSKRTPFSEEAFIASSKVERGAVAAVRRYPESAVVMVADARTHLAGAGDGGW